MKGILLLNIVKMMMISHILKKKNTIWVNLAKKFLSWTMSFQEVNFKDKKIDLTILKIEYDLNN